MKTTFDDRVLEVLKDAVKAPGPQVVRTGLRRSVRRGVYGFGLAAAAATATAAVVLVTGSSTGTISAPVTPKLSAQQVLLAAADRTGKATGLTSGRYWRTSTLGTYVEVAGPDGNHYQVLSQSKDEMWTAFSPKETSWWIHQRLAARPAGPTDVAAWKKDGSPTTYKIVGPKNVKGQQLKLTMPSTPGKIWRDPSSGSAGDVFAIGDKNVTVAEIQSLPTDPAALRARLLGRPYKDPGQPNGDLPANESEWLFKVTTGMIQSMPLTPGIRAAAYRLLAAIPGVQSLGTVKDSKGRSGSAVAFVEHTINGSFQDRFIIDPRTGLPLSYEMRQVSGGNHPAGTLTSATTVDFAGWTNATPPNYPRMSLDGGN